MSLSLACHMCTLIKQQQQHSYFFFLKPHAKRLYGICYAFWLLQPHWLPHSVGGLVWLYRLGKMLHTQHRFACVYMHLRVCVCVRS